METPIFFNTAKEFRAWLKRHHESADVLWVGYYKKGAQQSGISYDESVCEALCFGWIDGLIHGIDDKTYKRRFTPRNPKSKWSKSNVKRIREMVEAGKMRPAGMALVEAAKKSGAWESAYRLADDHEVPPALEKALKQNPEAWENFQRYSNSNKHAFIVRVRDAKTAATKKRRIEKTVELAEKNLPPYDEKNRSRI